MLDGASLLVAALMTTRVNDVITAKRVSATASQTMLDSSAHLIENGEAHAPRVKCSAPSRTRERDCKGLLSLKKSSSGVIKLYQPSLAGSGQPPFGKPVKLPCPVRGGRKLRPILYDFVFDGGA